jgi:hypothetical protein
VLACREAESLSPSPVESIFFISLFANSVEHFENPRGSEDIYTVQVYEKGGTAAFSQSESKLGEEIPCKNVRFSEN